MYTIWYSAQCHGSPSKTHAISEDLMQEPYTISRVNTNTSQKPTRILILLLSIIFKYFLCFLFPQLKKECEFSYKYPHKNSTANISEVELIIDFA